MRRSIGGLKAPEITVMVIGVYQEACGWMLDVCGCVCGAACRFSVRALWVLADWTPLTGSDACHRDEDAK